LVGEAVIIAIPICSRVRSCRVKVRVRSWGGVRRLGVRSWDLGVGLRLGVERRSWVKVRS
jgi:hypothetical protein